jgi:sterol desaturase/sphingolipid hydroxylase (fatty acid hydroxylase superfamily)
VIWHSRAVSHKTHHEHNHPSVLTNQHFTIADLFVEAYIPAIIALSVLAKGLRVPVSPVEEALIGGYIAWQEQCSHSGKPVPFSSMVAPLAPLYNHLLGLRWDRRNVEFHQVHHERMRCNYSITQWLDNLMGTTRWE